MSRRVVLLLSQMMPALLFAAGLHASQPYYSSGVQADVTAVIEAEYESEYQRAKAIYADTSRPNRFAEAFELLLELANRGHVLSERQVGLMYRDGTGVKANKKLAAFWFEKAANQGETFSAYHLGNLLLEGGDGLKKDKKAGTNWIIMSAELGNRDAQSIVGFFSLTGSGVPHSKENAAMWFLKSAEQGHAIAQCQIAEMFLNGVGVEKDPSKAFAWYQKAADQGSADGKLGLALMYRSGVGIPKDSEKALQLLEKASVSEEAVYYRGMMYLNGEGMAPDGNRGLQLIRESANRGYPKAQVTIGHLYLSGDAGLLQDYQVAANWFMRAAAREEAEAQYTLAKMYWYGHGVEKSRVTAYAWVNLSAARGNEYAKNLRKQWASELSVAGIERAQALSREWHPGTILDVVRD